MKKKSIKLTIFSIILLLAFAGCGQSKQGGQGGQGGAQRESAQSGQQSDKIPDQLTSMESSIERILMTLNGPSVGVRQEQTQGGAKQGAKQQSQGGQQGQGQGQGQSKDQGTQDKKSGQGSDKQGQGGQQGQSQGQGGQQGQAAAQTQTQDPWQQLAPMINTLHYTWNDYMPKAVKMGASKELIDSFSTALNSLTSTIIGKNQTNTLMASSYLYAYIPDFYALYKTPTSPEIKRIRYYTRNAMLNAMTGNWTQSDSDMTNLKSSWSLFKNTIAKEQQDTSNKLDFSIYELDKVIKSKDQPLSDIKGRVALANVEALEKASQGGQQGQGGSQSGGGGSSGGGSSGGGGGGSSSGGGGGGSSGGSGGGGGSSS